MIAHLCKLSRSMLLAVAFAVSTPSAARPVDPLPPVLGEPSKDLVRPGEDLVELAYRHRLGFDAISRLNPQVKVWIPDPGTVVELPTEYVLPEAPRKGLLINVPEMRLYDFTRGGEPEVYAIAIGDDMDPSLVGDFRVGAKRKNPAWTVPASIRAERPELPAVVPPGPDNPLGDHWMTIGNTSYGIHGTNNPWSIGRMATHGCIRLYDDQLAGLFERVPSGTPIRLIYQSVKLGVRSGALYVEAHPDPYRRDAGRLEAAIDRLAAAGLAGYVDLRRLRRAIDAGSGVPVQIGTLPESAPASITSRPAS
ncbi:L,D-transpeptidase ErfK/SrfK [Myxococcaceae bacterium]|nr:L,D-transpeptidase ErfK/SrfK [Myxococcaceae bacterium]